MNARDTRRRVRGPRERFQWDMVTVSVLILIVVLFGWLTSELWLPHLGPR